MFQCGVVVVACKDSGTFLKSLPNIFKKYKIEYTQEDIRNIEKCFEEDSEPLGVTIYSMSPDIYVYFKEENISKVSYELMVLEFHHVSSEVCEEHGIDDEETEAYLQEYIFHEFLCRIDDYNEKKKKSKKRAKKAAKKLDSKA